MVLVPVVDDEPPLAATITTYVPAPLAPPEMLHVRDVPPVVAIAVAHASVAAPVPPVKVTPVRATPYKSVPTKDKVPPNGQLVNAAVVPLPVQPAKVN